MSAEALQCAATKKRSERKIIQSLDISGKNSTFLLPVTYARVENYKVTSYHGSIGSFNEKCYSERDFRRGAGVFLSWGERGSENKA